MYNNAHLRNTLDIILTRIELTTSNYLKVFRDMAKNYLNKIRESLLMSKAELARKANVSPITIARIENNQPCRMETKRKILLALGYKLSEKHKIFRD
jgi:DNA-binding XRE family transcriptional regulator